MCPIAFFFALQVGVEIRWRQMPRRKFGTHWEVCAMLAALGASNFSAGKSLVNDDGLRKSAWICYLTIFLYIPIRSTLRSIVCNLSQMSHGIGHLRNGASSGPTHRSSWAMCIWGLPKWVRWPRFPRRSREASPRESEHLSEGSNFAKFLRCFRQFTRIPPNGVDGLSKEVSHFCCET